MEDDLIMVIKGRKLRAAMDPIVNESPNDIQHVRLRLNIEDFKGGWNEPLTEYFEITGICSQEMAVEILRRFNAE